MAFVLPIGMGVKLSRREREVADLILDGCSDRQMAASLKLSVHTINTYTKSLFRKLGIHKRSAIARAAMNELRRRDCLREVA